ncbi:MAG: enoyl-CoA hydratase, partial [Actinobacteria bacterium]|nr:enoyl-CoA hydratase [Actinomycetota bacterium]
DEALAYEQQQFNGLFGTADARTGIMAFVDKESPVFEGK